MSAILISRAVDFLLDVVAGQQHSKVSLLIVCSTNRAIPPARSALQAIASPPPHRKIACRLTRLTSITRVELNTIGHFVGKGCPSA